MTAETVSRGARRFIAASALLLVAWQAGALVGLPRRVEVTLALYGVVLHAVFGKAYSLVPSYFEREPALEWAPAVHFPLALSGTLLLAAGALRIGPPVVGAVGGLLWLAGVGVFLGATLWTVRGNLSGRETATGETNADRRPVDRFANAFVPVVLAYLVAGSYETAAARAGLPTLLGGYPPRATHLLAAGTAALLLFAIGFRLLPRFLVARPPRALVAVVLPAGALGPALVAVGLPSGPLFRAGAAAEAVAVIGFALAYATLFVRSNRRRVGFYGPLVGTAAGAVAALIGLSFAFGGVSGSLVLAHLRLNLLGLLGLSIVGVVYQFYPPAVGTFPGASDRTALASIALIGAGLAVEVVGLLVAPALSAVGALLALAGALAFAYLVLGLFNQRYW